MGHVVSLWSHRHPVHRIQARLLVPTDQVRYHHTDPWQVVTAVRDISTTTVATLRVEHLDGPPRFLATTVMVDARYRDDA